MPFQASRGGVGAPGRGGGLAWAAPRRPGRWQAAGGAALVPSGSQSWRTAAAHLAPTGERQARGTRCRADAQHAGDDVALRLAWTAWAL